MRSCDAGRLQLRDESGSLAGMIFSFSRLVLGLAALAALAACTQRLPEAVDMDQYYRRAEQLAKEDRAEAERRHADGSLNDFAYRQELERINDHISKSAMEMAYTALTLEKKRRESLGLPTADHPQYLQAPGAGSLPTGSDFRAFNQKIDGAYGGAGQTVNDIRGSMNNYRPGMNVRAGGG